VRGELLLAILEQLSERWLVGDRGPHEFRVRLHQRQGGDGAAGGTEHGRRPGIEMADQPGQIVGAQLRGGLGVRVVEDAAEMPARVQGKHGVAGCQLVRKRAERRRVHRCAHDGYQRAASAQLVVEPGAGDRQGAGGNWSVRGHRHSSRGLSRTQS
jgi:hypothetical protein